MWAQWVVQVSHARWQSEQTLCARLHHLVVFHVVRLLFLRLPLLSERYQADDGEG